MQAHVRHVEKFTNFMSPVGLSLSHYNNSHPRKRQRFTNLTNPPNITGNISSGSGSNSDTDHATKQKHQIKPHRNKANSVKVNTVNTPTVSLHNHNDDISSTVCENRWTRENLSLSHLRNRAMYLDHDTVNINNESMNNILDKLLIYGYETSADIAKMQPWQLRVLKKEIPQIDFIFMTAYRMWGKQEYYDDTQNLTFRQYWDPAVWLQYNEIELIIKCFDVSNRGYQCMICGVRHGLNELDVVRWHIWLEHKDSNQLNAIMQSTKKHNQHNFTKPLQNLQLPPLDNKSVRMPQVISLLDSSDDDELMEKRKRKKTSPYNHKARAYSSKRNNTRRRRSRRLANKNAHSPEIITPKTVQNPIIVNGCNDDDDDVVCDNNNNGVMQIHGSLSPAFMPSAEFNDDNKNKNTNVRMDMDEYNWNNNNVTDMNGMNEFNMIGFNDDFSTLGVLGALSRNSSDSFNDLNGAFVDPGKNFEFSFQSQEKLNLNSNFANPY